MHPDAANTPERRSHLGHVRCGQRGAKQTAIAHSQITEIYYVLSGAGTFVTGGTMPNTSAVAAEGTVVKVLVGPSTTGATIAGGQSRRIGPGDASSCRLGWRTGSARLRATWTTWCSEWTLDTSCRRDLCIPLKQ